MILGVLLLLSNGVKEIVLKKLLNGMDASFLMWILSFCTSILVLPFVIQEWFPELSPKFFWAFFSWGILYLVWKYFYFRALKYWEISYISPLKWIISIGVVFTGWLLLWELPSLLWGIWISIIVIGIYFLSLQKSHIKVLDPVIHLFTDKGSRLFLITVVAYSFSTSIDKVWVLETSPFFWALCMNLFIFFSVLPSVIIHFKKWYKSIKKSRWFLPLIVVLHAGVYSLHMYTIELMLSSYVSAFKNSSAIFTVIVGWIIFKEKDLKKKVWATLIIVFWVVLMMLW